MIIGHFVFRRRWLSNFYHCHVEYKGRVYQSVEHAYQAQKAAQKLDHDWIAKAVGAAEAKRRGKTVKLRPGFDEFKQRLMLKLLWSKFHHNPRLRTKLLQTGRHELVHGNTHHDEFWGVNRTTGEGKNRLGFLLMLLRDQIRDGTDHTIPDMGTKKLDRHRRYRQRVKERLEDENLAAVVRPLPKLTHEQTIRSRPSKIKAAARRVGDKEQSRKAKMAWPARKWDEEFYRKDRLKEFGPQKRLDPNRFKK